MSIQHSLQQLAQLTAGHLDLYPGQLQEIIKMVNSPGCDICEHVPTLIKYGQQAKHITEFGVRFGWSTRSFLFAKPKYLRSVDLFEWNSTDQSGAPGPLTQASGNTQYYKYKALYEGVVEHDYTLGDTTKIPKIKTTDLLFIDTFHHGDCLIKELTKHGNQSRKWIILHDTVTFGTSGQDDPGGCFFAAGTIGGPGTGLMDAVYLWLASNLHWKIKEHHTNNNGLTVLERN